MSHPESIEKILKRLAPKHPLKHEGPALPPEYKCPICKDAGFGYPRLPSGEPDYSRVVPCQCAEEGIKKDRAERLLKHCALPAKTEGKTFATFRLKDKATKEARDVALRMASGDDNVVFLTLMADPGRGKSHLAIAICREWLGRGEPAKYAYVPELLNAIRASYKKDESTGESFSQLLEVLKTVPLLVLDDLGTEKKSEWAIEQLQMIVDARSRSALPLVVTTNKALTQLPNDDEGRIASRLQREDWCKVVVF